MGNSRPVKFKSLACVLQFHGYWQNSEDSRISVSIHHVTCSKAPCSCCSTLSPSCTETAWSNHGSVFMDSRFTSQPRNPELRSPLSVIMIVSNMPDLGDVSKPTCFLFKPETFSLPPKLSTMWTPENADQNVCLHVG